MASSEKEPWYAISLISYVAPKDRAGFFLFAEVVTRAMAECFGGRPHWGKVCPLNADLARRVYPQLDQFKLVMQDLDRQRLFSNDWLRRVMPTDSTR